MEENLDKAMRKAMLLARAIKEVNEADSSLEELKADAFEVLLLNPGSDFHDWTNELTQNYGMEVVDAYGADPAEAYASLTDLWESEYYDRASDMEMTYSQWSRAFATEEAREIYYCLVEERK